MKIDIKPLPVRFGSAFDREAETYMPDGWKVSGQILPWPVGTRRYGNDPTSGWYALATSPAGVRVIAIGYTMELALSALVVKVRTMTRPTGYM